MHPSVVERAHNRERGPAMARNRRVLTDALISASALVALLLALVAIDDRVREQILMRVNAGPTAQVTNLGSTLGEVAAIITAAARDQSIEHAPLMIFVVAGTVLVLFMLRM